MTRHLLDVDDLGADGVRAVLDLARVADPPPVLAGRGVALVFEHPSNRTRSSSELAVVALGGHPVTIRAEEVGWGRRETVEDVARSLACYHAMIGARVSDHTTLERMVAALDGAGARVPVVNLLSDRAHPCQALADLLTLEDALGPLAGRKLAWVGDANNTWRSLASAAALVGLEVRTASPPGYGPTAQDEARLGRLGAEVQRFERPEEAVAGADAVGTDVWASMGQEDEARARRAAFSGFTVDAALMARAPAHAVALHCLPAHRGEEISAEVLEGRQSRVWEQAANRLHAMRAALLWLDGAGGA